MIPSYFRVSTPSLGERNGRTDAPDRLLRELVELGTRFDSSFLWSCIVPTSGIAEDIWRIRLRDLL